MRRAWNKLQEYDLSNRSHRYLARKAGLDVPKLSAGAKPRKDIFSYIEKTETCWLWNGGLNEWGYGTFSENGRTIFAHRRVWEIVNKSSAKGFVVMHSCDNPRCCNPEHLSLGTHASNQRDKFNKSRQAKGVSIGASKLTDDLVYEIRRKYSPRKYTYEMLAIDYGVCKDTIRKAIKRINWSHVE